jgi:hypothetical protein
VVTNGNDPERRAIALAWMFHFVGDIHQPLHTARLFTVEYPQGHRGGNEICVGVMQDRQPMDLHRFWDWVIASSSNLTRLRNQATVLRNRQEFQRSQLTELARTDFDSWAKECAMVAAAPVLPAGYVISASWIADRRIILAGYRLAEFLIELTRK